MLTYEISARPIDAHRSTADTKDALITLDTDIGGRAEAFNPAELLLASIAACMIKGAEQVTPMIQCDLRRIKVRLHRLRQDAPPKSIRIDNKIIVGTTETDLRFDLLLKNIRKYAAISNTIATAAELNGVIGHATSEA